MIYQRASLKNCVHQYNKVSIMIELLGTISIPEQLLEYLKTAAPSRSISQLAGKSFEQQIKLLGSDRCVDNYKFYTESSTGTIEFREEWFKDIVPKEFLKQHGFSYPINAVVLQVQPGHFTAPHQDRFNGTVFAYDQDVPFDNIIRLWIPVEDCKFGQVLFVESDVIHNFRQGQVYQFGNYDFHSAANAGLDHRYTLIVYCKKIKIS